MSRAMAPISNVLPLAQGQAGNTSPQKQPGLGLLGQDFTTVEVCPQPPGRGKEKQPPPPPPNRAAAAAEFWPG